MGKFLCECGYRFSDTVLPNDKYFSLVPSELVWETPEKISPTDEIEIWECPDCKGLTRFDGTAYRTCYYKRVDDTGNDMPTEDSKPSDGHSEASKSADTKGSKYSNGRDEPCEICGDGGHTEIACPNQGGSKT